MFTQCPECDVAFRVTAGVLKQAAGKVRCGRCGNAFNALEYLSEDRPRSRHAAAPATDPDLPELEPEADSAAELAADTPPRFISAEQSAALLKTLDDLAGEDIRIEDTGVEWRVVTDDEEDDADGLDDGDPPDDEARAATGMGAMRFDDDTPLPEDFDFEAESVAAPEPAPPAEPDPVSGQVDLALGDPDEWEDLLEEVGDIGDDAGPGPAGADEPGPSAADDDALADAHDDDAGDLDAAAANPDRFDQVPGGADLFDEDPFDDKHLDEDPVDEDRLGDDPDGADEARDTGDTSIEEDLIAAAFETEAAARASSPSGTFAAPGDPPGGAASEASGFEIDISEEELSAAAPELADDLPHEEVPSGVERELAEREDASRHQAGATPGAGIVDLSVELTADDAQSAGAGDFDLPEMSEEERTINMMIDQDLLAIAVEDDDGFTSTIVQKQAPGSGAADDRPEEDAADTPAPAGRLVETIIMEGESFRAEDDEEPGTPGLVAVPADTADTGAAAGPRRRVGLAAGVAGLTLLLALQVVHYSRDALATVPALNEAIGPIYRALGRPVSPDWDVSGWRFEATKGSADEGGGRLTIYSRIGNTSDAPLPLPLVRVSLTDRYQEVIGSRIVEPARYLVGDADPRETVAPGQAFSAVIGIEAPAPEATGFTLNVCYRLASNKLKCAVEDFK